MFCPLVPLGGCDLLSILLKSVDSGQSMISLGRIWVTFWNSVQTSSVFPFFFQSVMVRGRVENGKLPDPRLLNLLFPASAPSSSVILFRFGTFFHEDSGPAARCPDPHRLFLISQKGFFLLDRTTGLRSEARRPWPQFVFS